MHKSRRISLSPVSPSKSSILTSGTWGTEEYSRPFIDSSVAVVSMASSCQQWSHHSPPRYRAEGEMGTVWAGTTTPVCFLFQTVSHFVVWLPLSRPCLFCSDLASVVFLLICFVVVVFGFNFFVFTISFASCPEVLAYKKKQTKKTSAYEHIWRDSEKKRCVKRSVVRLRPHPQVCSPRCLERSPSRLQVFLEGLKLSWGGKAGPPHIFIFSKYQNFHFWMRSQFAGFFHTCGKLLRVWGNGSSCLHTSRILPSRCLHARPHTLRRHIFLLQLSSLMWLQQ